RWGTSIASNYGSKRVYNGRDNWSKLWCDCISWFNPCSFILLSCYYASSLPCGKKKSSRNSEAGFASSKRSDEKARTFNYSDYHLIVLLFRNMPVGHAAFWTIVATVIVASFRKTTRMSFKDILEAMSLGARQALTVVIACA